MMLNPTHPGRTRHRVVAVAAAGVVLAALSLPAVAGTVRFDTPRSLVQCTPIRLPVLGSPSHGLVRRIQGNRFFAPTRQAVFFSRAGDRCSWHSPHLARG